MTRGYSLEKDLRLLLNNPKYSDIEILCEDEKKLYGCKAILAARSEVFDKLLYNGMKETYEKQVSFPKINSSAMEIILEYIYTGSIKEESLTKDNIIEAFYATDYFQLPDLQELIITTLKNILEKNFTENYSPELLSKIVTMMPLSDDNILLNLLVETVATIPLNTIEFNRLSIKAFQYLLSCTHEKEKPFATPEYEVFRYSAILAAKQVSNEAYKTYMEGLPTLEQIDYNVKVEDKIVTDHQKVAKELEPLIKFIDFRRIKGQILVNIIEPLEIIPSQIILSVYRYKTLSDNSNLSNIRGIPVTTYNDHTWDESECGSKLIIEDNGKVVRASDNCSVLQSVRSRIALEDKGIFEWDVIIEKDCFYAWIGVCSSENFNYETFVGYQSAGWVLGSGGRIYNFSHYRNNYCPQFGDGAKITVHLDMDKRTCAFTVNGIKYPEIPEWNNLPSKLYPVVSLKYPGRFRIQHR
ncbi:concanavalin A-like lectin/glucanase domain-containing protein [Glomus cerebriforme]|uniref:Concanavalin A-like lectin/glucanase domain-containing protein n=1 Tax=Glomus cerebriforme TaxID=658196 RepID=A0A397SLT2_9GLOM|nr:concanavalin A-like lectin/glucanase domain-containing protein [Glomus cerebriforme]